MEEPQLQLSLPCLFRHSSGPCLQRLQFCTQPPHFLKVSNNLSLFTSGSVCFQRLHFIRIISIFNKTLFSSSAPPFVQDCVGPQKWSNTSWMTTIAKIFKLKMFKISKIFHHAKIFEKSSFCHLVSLGNIVKIVYFYTFWRQKSKKK